MKDDNNEECYPVLWTCTFTCPLTATHYIAGINTDTITKHGFTQEMFSLMKQGIISHKAQCSPVPSTAPPSAPPPAHSSGHQGPLHWPTINSSEAQHNLSVLKQTNHLWWTSSTVWSFLMWRYKSGEVPALKPLTAVSSIPSGLMQCKEGIAAVFTPMWFAYFHGGIQSHLIT